MKFLLDKVHAGQRPGCCKEETFSPLKNRTGGLSWEVRNGEMVSLAASCLPWSSLSGRVSFLPVTVPDTPAWRTVGAAFCLVLWDLRKSVPGIPCPEGTYSEIGKGLPWWGSG